MSINLTSAISRWMLIKAMCQNEKKEIKRACTAYLAKCHLSQKRAIHIQKHREKIKTVLIA
jgi:hypothetical protein